MGGPFDGAGHQQREKTDKLSITKNINLK
jgi:hypothetical protein